MAEPRARRPATHPCTWPGCSALLTCPHHLQQHIREKHTLERPFVCDHCAEAGKETKFARNASLLRHLRTVHKLEVDTTRGHGNNESLNNPQTEVVQSDLGNLLRASLTAYLSPADNNCQDPPETPYIRSSTSTPGSAAAHSAHWSPVSESTIRAPETAILDSAFEHNPDLFANNDMRGPVECACCQKIVQDIRTHFNACLNGTVPPENPTGFDKELGDLHAFSADLDVYGAQLTGQQSNPPHN